MNNRLSEVRESASDITQLQPKSKEKVKDELAQLSKQFGLPKADANMKETRLILRRVGSLST